MSQYSKNNYTGNKNNSMSRAFDLVKARSIVLDVGCSSGNFGRALSDIKKCQVDGIEIDSDDARLAKKYLRKVIVGDIEKDTLDIDLGEYDHITFCDVIEHLRSPQLTLSKIRELMKKDASIVFSIPNMAHASVRLMLLEGKFSYGETGLLDNTHLHFYTRQSIVDLFEGAGFKIEKLEYTEIDYSERIIDETLKKIGLKRIVGKNIFNEEESVAYQYIGVASPVHNDKKYKSNKLPLISPDPEYPYKKYYGEREALYIQQIKELQKQIDDHKIKKNIFVKVQNKMIKIINAKSNEK